MTQILHDRSSKSPRAVFLMAAALAAACAGAQPRETQDASVAAAIAPQQELWERVLAAEDARGRGPAGIAPLVEALASEVAALRAIAVRGLGRLEQPELADTIALALDDADAQVRAEAANALGQAVLRGDPAPVRALLRTALETEEDPRVRGVIGETLGRSTLPLAGRGGAGRGGGGRAGGGAGGAGGRSGGTGEGQARPTDDAPAIAAILASLAAESAEWTRFGAAKGFYFLARQPAGRAAVAARADAVRTLGAPGASAIASDTALSAVRTRRLAAAALNASGAATVDDLHAWMRDPDGYVRREAVIGAGRLNDAGAAAQLIADGLVDGSAAVRYEALRLAGRGDRAGCMAPLGSLRDGDPHVALLAIDQLGSCEPAGLAEAALDSIAARLDAGGAGWHAPAHALIALAGRSPERAAARLPAFASHPNGFVRAYAARAAAQLGDVARLRALAADADPNVRTEVVRGLARLEAHSADDVYLAQLEPRPIAARTPPLSQAGPAGSPGDRARRRVEPDPQLSMAAAAALEGSPHPRAAAALLDALDTLTADSAETSRDARVALIERAAELGTAAHASRLRPYLSDIDPAVAAAAADAIGVWTGERGEPVPQPLPPAPLPGFETIAALERDRFVFTMDDGAEIVIALDPFNAPTNAARFARLAQAGAYDGLTFHRVVPNFVVQGGSPAANEYSGDPAFSRDELGIDGNWRGTIGLSTRGRDTGDAQFYINLIDNVRLDHEYTTFGRVVEGMGVVDGLLEGAAIRSVRRRETRGARTP